MKKKVAIVLSMILIVSNSMVVFGANAKDDLDVGLNATKNQEVTASYTPNENKVYNVDIIWGNMQYTYSKTGGTGEWNPNEHTYGTGIGSWALTPPGITGTDDAITVGNHSNDIVYAEIKCDFVSTYSNLVGEFKKIDAQCSVDGTFEFADNTNSTKNNTPKAKFKLASAENRGKTFNNNRTTGLPQGKAQFEIAGDPGSALSGTKIGTITVTISNIEPTF